MGVSSIALLIVSIVFLSIGFAAVLVGIIFLLISKNLASKTSHNVIGKITDMTWNAAEFNEAQGDKGVEIGGMNVKVGSRPARFEIGETGIGVNTIRTTTSTPRNMFHKVFEYTVDGVTYKRAEGVRYNKGTVEKCIGKEVTVYYDAKNPMRASLSSGKGYKITYLILLIVGIPSLLGGITGLIASLIM